MPQTLKLANFNSSNLLDPDSGLLLLRLPGTTSLPVSNTENFANSGFILAGPVSGKNSELLQATTVTAANSVPLVSVSLLPHSQFDPVYALFGDQLNVYRAQDAGLGQQPADTAFSLIATGAELILTTL